MSANIPPPSPAGPRSNSTGPNGALPTPTSAAVVNGVGPAAAGASAPAPPGGNAPLSQQNLNQIVSMVFPGRLRQGCRATQPFWRAFVSG